MKVAFQVSFHAESSKLFFLFCIRVYQIEGENRILNQHHNLALQIFAVCIIWRSYLFHPLQV